MPGGMMPEPADSSVKIQPEMGQIGSSTVRTILLNT